MSNHDNLNATHETLDGGVTRVSISRPVAGNTDDHAQRMVNMNVRTQDSRDTRMSVTTGIGEAASSSGVITNAISTQGMPRAGSAITEDSLINIEGIPVRIGDAIKMGLASKNANGTFSLGKR